MIATNFRKHPEAMALQMVLPFLYALVWQTARPGVRVLRTIRAARAAAFKAAGRIKAITKATVPTWWKAAKQRAKALAIEVKTACLVLIAEVRIATADGSTDLLGFRTWQEIARDCWMPADTRNGTRRRAALTPIDPGNTRRVRDGKLMERLQEAPVYSSYCSNWTKHDDAGYGWGEWAAYWGGEST
jgi:hypothetical protein